MAIPPLSIDDYNKFSASFKVTDTDGDGVVTRKDVFITRDTNKSAQWIDVQRDVETCRFQSAAQKLAPKGKMSSVVVRALYGMIPTAKVILIANGEISISGENVRLPNGLILTSGIVHFKSGRFFTTANNRTVINGVGIISPTNDPDPIYLYADPNRIPVPKNADRYALFEQSSFTLSGIQAVFTHSNQYADVKPNQYLVIDLPYGEITLEFIKGKPLKLNFVVKTSDYILNVRNGPWDLSIINNEFNGLAKYITSEKYIPLEIEFKDGKGMKKSLEDYSPNTRELLSGYNNLIFNDSKITATVERTKQGNSVKSIGEALPLIDYTSWAKTVAPNMKFHIPFRYYNHGQTYAELVRILSTCTPEMIAATRIISLHSLPRLRKICEVKGDVKGCTSKNSAEIHIKGQSDTVDRSIVKHELAHKLTTRYGKKLQDKWESIAGKNLYGKNTILDRDSNPIGWKTVVQGEIATGPQDGFVRPYGSKNYKEDISTFVEKVDDPEFFVPLITVGSNQYDRRYQEKLEVLLEFKYITQDQYDKVIEAARHVV